MNLKSNTILITGGASGIGFALAEHFLKLGNTVIVCGRRKDKLNEAKIQHPQLHIKECDIAIESERLLLFNWCQENFPQLNVIINNAGIQRKVDLTKSENDWNIIKSEISINLDAPIHLSTLFINFLLKQNNPVIMNVTSGLAFSPLVTVPVYCATKAALRSYTLSLRHQLANTPIKVIEIIPPAVNTDLGGVGLHTFGAPLDEFSSSVMEQLKDGKIEITFGFSEIASNASRGELNETFKKMNQ